MNDKTDASGAPNVRYLADALAAAGVQDASVVLPITDPYVVHHGALGSFAMVYLPASAAGLARSALERLPGVEGVLGREEAAWRFDLPQDRIGDLVVLADRNTVLGKSRDQHDLSAVQTGLRSHGGLHEAVVPVVVCHPLVPDARARMVVGDVANSDLLDFALNGIEPPAA
jgi:phosphonoacetate hydrolase